MRFLTIPTRNLIWRRYYLSCSELGGLYVKGTAHIIGCWMSTWTVLSRKLIGSNWKRTSLTLMAAECGNVTSRRRRNATAISAAIGRTLHPITSPDADSSTVLCSNADHAALTLFNADLLSAYVTFVVLVIHLLTSCLMLIVTKQVLWIIVAHQF